MNVIVLLEGNDLKTNEPMFLELPMHTDDFVWEQNTKDVKEIIDIANTYFNEFEDVIHIYDCFGMLTEYGELIWEDGTITSDGLDMKDLKLSSLK